MEKKIKLQILFFVMLVMGFILTLFNETKSYGFLFLCVIQSIVALYYIFLFKQTEAEVNRTLTLRYPLLILLQVIFVFFIILNLFRIMSWPFYAPVKFFLLVLITATLLLSICFVVVNRKIIQSIFVVELVMMTLPIILFLGSYTSSNYSKEEYLDVLHHQYQDLNQIENTLYLGAKKDSLFDFTVIDFISDVKKETIHMTGGIDDDGIIKGSLHSIDLDYVELKFRMKKRQILVDEIRLANPKTTIEYLNVLTKLQIDLLLKERK